MKLVIFGATGATGVQLVEQGIAAGHTITAVARKPEAITLRHAHLRVVQVDVFDAVGVAAAIAGQDAVISAIGATSLDPTTVFSEGTAHMLQGMKQHQVQRITVISASALDVGATIPFWQKAVIRLVLQRLLKHAYADARRMEKALYQSDVTWTIIRAPRLTNGAIRQRYRVAYDAPLSQAGISRADLAHYILTHLNDPASYHKKVELAYG